MTGRNFAEAGIQVSKDIISIRNLYKYYGRQRSLPALDGVTLEIHKGELLVLLGPSGCGKTTLLRSIAGLEDPTLGHIDIFGQNVIDTEAGINVPSQRRHVGMVFQNYALWPHMTVLDNVTYPLRARGVNRRSAHDEAAKILGLLQCGHLLQRYPSQLSGGQQQRIALGRSLVGSPQTVLFDEPLSNVDAQLRREVRTEIRRLHSELGFTGVYVTHDQREGLELGDRIAIMRNGVIVQLGTPVEIHSQPISAYAARFLGVENNVTCQFQSGRIRAKSGRLLGDWESLALEPNSDFEVFVRSSALRVRPSQVEADGEQLGDEKLLGISNGVVTDILFGGDESEIVIQCGDERFFALRKAHVHDIEIGQQVDCFFDRSDALVYPVNVELVPPLDTNEMNKVAVPSGSGLH